MCMWASRSTQSSPLILQMRKLHSREVKGLTQGHTAGRGGAKSGLEPGLLVQSSFQQGCPNRHTLLFDAFLRSSKTQGPSKHCVRNVQATQIHEVIVCSNGSHAWGGGGGRHTLSPFTTFTSNLLPHPSRVPALSHSYVQPGPTLKS